MVVEVRARAFEPGEPVRVVARSPKPVESVEGTLRGEKLTFVATNAEAGASTTWSAWAVIDLDWPAGSVTVAVTGRGPDAFASTGRATFTVGKKSFPVSELKVESKYVNPPKDVQARIDREQAKLARIYAQRRAVALPPAAFVRPVDGEPTSVFGARRVFNGEKRKAHAGLDLRAATGTPVKCAGPGLVTLAEDLYFSGGTVIVDHGGGLFTVYAHLSRIDVKADAPIAAADLVGLSGATGRVTGPHLHWGGKVGGSIFDPTALLDPRLFEE
jgi:murein DD-endopeptidase MepM/ murein hydrolase activator NlpD